MYTKKYSKPCVIFSANRGFALTNSRTLLIKHFLSAGWEVVAVTKNDKYAKQLSEMGVLLEPILFNRGGVSIQNDFNAFLRLLTIYRKYRPTLIHNFNAKPVIFGCFVGYFVSEAKIINTITGLGHAFVLGGMVRYLAAAGYKFSLRRCAFTIFQNSDDLKLFVENGWIAKGKVRLITSSGIDTERFYPAVVDSANHMSKVLMASRLLWQKGVKEFVEAGEIVKRQFPNVCYQLAGEWDLVHQDAVDKPWVEAAADKGTIEFLGYINDMPEELRSTDIFVLPSYYPEGVPRVLLEAAACGVPVVTVDTPGCREGVVDGVTGRLVPPRNSKALADAICELLADPELRQRMSKAARQRIESEFDIRTITEKYLDVYREIGIEI